jgi:hypothetical protein
MFLKTEFMDAVFVFALENILSVTLHLIIYLCGFHECTALLEFNPYYQ